MFCCVFTIEAEKMKNLCKQLTARVEMFAGIYPAFFSALPKGALSSRLSVEAL